jgi:hypothetical protein
MPKSSIRKMFLVGFMLFVGILALVPMQAQEAPPGVVDTAIAAANLSNPELGEPDNWNWEQLVVVTNDSLGCSLATGADILAPVTPYRVELIYNNAGTYKVYVSADSSIVRLCDEKFSNPEAGSHGAIQVAAPPPLPGDICILSTMGAYSNVRGRPELGATQVGTIFENSEHAVIGRNISGTWYLIDSGWVNHAVIRLDGECSTLPISDTVVNNSGPEVSGNLYPCAADFAGYLPTRLEIGRDDPYAKVSEGGFPNRIRNQPSTASVILGEIPPGSLFEILDGPACNEGYVWWQVAFNAVAGWTVESNVATGEYYVESTQAESSVEVPANARLISDNAGAQVLAFDYDGAAIATTEASSGYVIVNVYNFIIDPQLPVLQMEHIAPVNNVVFPTGQQVIATVDFNGIYVWGMHAGSWEPIYTLPDVSTNPAGFVTDLSPDWSLLAVTSCLADDPLGCTNGEVRIWDIVSSQMIQTLSPEGETMPQIIDFRIDNTVLLVYDGVTVTLWNAPTGVVLNTIPTTMPFISQAIFSPDGHYVALAGCRLPNTDFCGGGEVEIWDVTTMTIVNAMVTPDTVTDVDFSPDSRFIAGVLDTSIVFWDVATGEHIKTLNGHTDMVNNVVFAPTYSQETGLYYLASVDWSGVAFLWDVELSASQ